MAEHRLSERNAKIAAMLESGEGLKNFYRFIAQNEYINLHDACQIVAERPNATVCNTLEEWNAMGRRVIKGRKSIAYYDHDGYKQFVFDANDTYGDGRYQRPILPLKHLLIGLDELNGTNAYEENGRSDYRKIHNGVYTYLEKQRELTGDEQYDRLLAEGITYSLYCKTGFPKTQNIRLHGLPYSYRENAAFVKELYIRSELLAEEIEEAYQSKQSEVEVINDIDEETVSDEPIVQSEPAEQTETQEQPEQGAAVSPVYRQYLEAQKLDPKAIVLLRVGDFYEVMGENARTVAEEVGLTLTSRDVGLSERVPMCGFPYFASDAYMEKILEHHGVILAEDGKEPIYVLSHAEALEQGEKEETAHGEEAEELAALFGEEAEQTSPVRKPVLVEIDDEPNPFDDEQSEEEETEEDDFADDEADFEEEPEQEEAETAPALKKDEKGIQDRKRKQKPQLSMFDLIEPQGKSREEQIVDTCLKDEYSDYKLAYYDAYQKNLPVSGFVKLFKRHYGDYSGHSDGEKWITNTTKGREIKWRDKEHPENSFTVQLKWPEVAVRIAELIENDDYLTPNEKKEYARVVRFREERESAKTDGERCKVIADQIVEYGTQKTYSEVFSEYPHFLEDHAQFYFDHREEIKHELLTRKEVVSVRDQRDMFDNNISVSFHIKYCPRWQESLRRRLAREHRVQDFADRVIEDCASHYDAAQDGEVIEWMVTPEEIGERDYLFIKDNRDEFIEYLQSKAGVVSADLSMERIKIAFDRDHIAGIVGGSILPPGEQTRRVRGIADKIIAEGTENTTEGNWIHYFDEFGEDETFAREHAEEIAAELELHQEVSDVELTPDAFDTNFYLDYCPNYIPQEGEDGYEDSDESEPSNPEQAENIDLSEILDQTDLGGAKTRFKNNVAAIRIINFLDERGAMATDSEKKTLSQFVGWGGLSQAFDEKNESWKKEYAELKTLLSAEDYEQARSSTLNAYYTPKEVIGGIYVALERFGVKANNRILEPAMGTGNFFGYMPKEIADGSRLYGVELDNITGRIAAKLYPQASVQIKGFEDTSFPNDKFDLVVGNVPFGGYGVADSDYNRYNFKVHDYFLAKSVDKVRAGGIVAVITSKGTMDKLNPSARKYVAERAELLGAIRLPNNAFKQTAGTQAVADILFFRKREEKITDLSKEEWLGTGKTAEGYEINNYFLAHPEMILGTLAEEHGLYGGIDTTVKPDGRDLQDALAEAIQHLPQSFYINPETPPEQERETEVDYNVKPFCYKAERGKLYQRVGDEMVEQTVPKTPKDAYQRICGMIGLRESLHHILDIQIQGCSDEVLKSEQQKLNTQYDLFVRRYGYLNSQTNSKLFKDDGDSALLFACEDVDEQTKTVTKADVFFKRTIRPYTVPTSTDDPFETLQISKNERGKVDIAYIEELTGKSYDTVLSELGNAVFRDPEQVNAEDQYSGFVTSEEYLSGQVVTKLERAKALAAEHPEYQKNVAALEAVQPEPLSASEIAVRLGATWVDKAYYKQFYCELVGVRWYQESDVDLFYNPHDSSWRIDQTPNVRYTTQMNQTEVYGTKRAPAYRLFIDAVNLKATTIYDTIEEDGREKRVLNQAETIAAREKQNKIKEAFAEWIFKDPERREELEATYNRLFNRTRLPSYDGSYLKFPEMNPAIELKPHQRNAVHRIITSGSSTLLHHVVGAGKTFTVIASVMKMRQLGLCKKAMVTVPNHLVQQWAGEWRKLYPNANILVATKEDLEKDNRKKFVSKVALGDWDGIIIAQSSFAKIPVSKERQIGKLQEEIASVEETIERQWEENGMPRGAVKNLERIKKIKQAQLKKLMDTSSKDDVLKFEDLGVDYLFVDEAQNFKNLFLFTKMNNVAGISNAASQRASDLKLKCEYLQELHGSDRGVVFATGTPISNSMTEMYTMQTYLQPSVLRDLGITFFDGWAADFGETITSMELTPSGQGYRARTRFAKFTNLPELLKLYRSFADVQTADMVKLNVPEAERHVINLKPSDTIIELAEEIADRADRIYGGGVDSHIDNMLKVTSDGKKLALDPRCFVPTAEDGEGSKLNACAQNIYEIWEDTQSIKGTQIVFCDLSTPKVRFEDYTYGTDFDAYNDLKWKLVQKGIPEREIAFIHEANTDEQKQALFDKVNAGAVRVLVGSTEKCGAGTNVQKRLVALHHLDTPYRPSDMEQREGRIIRQGNTNEKVQIFTYVMERTFDSYSYQILENKQRFISQINRGDLTIREAEDIDETTLSYAEIKAITAANPKIKRKMEVDAEVARLRVLEGQYRKNLYDLQDKIYKTYPEEIRKQELLIERIGKDLEMLKTRRPADPEAFEIGVNGKVYTDRKEGGKALTDALYGGKVGTPVAEYCGFKIGMNPMSFLATEREITLAGEGQYVITIGDSASGNLTRIENFLNDFPEREKRLKSKLEQLKSDLVIAKEQAGKPFEQAERLKELLSEQAQLNAELNLNQREEVIVDDGDEDEEEITYRALPDMQRQNREVNIIDEEDKVAAMQVDVLPDYTVTQEDMHAYGYTWDGMLPVGGAAAKTLAFCGLTLYELRSNDTEGMVDDVAVFEETDRLFGVEKPEWNAFLQSGKGKNYIAVRREIVRSVFASLNGEDMRDFSNTELEMLWEQYGTELPVLDKAFGREKLSVMDMQEYALSVFDEQVEKLRAALPFEERGWSEADIAAAVYGNIEDEQLQRTLSDHAARSSKEIDYEAEVIKSVNTEFEVYKADMLSKSAEAIFEDSYKINTMSELKDILEIVTEHGYLQSEYYRALYEDRGSILTMLFNDYIKDEYTRLDTSGEAAEFVRDYCERHHKSALYADAPLYLKTARYAREHGESEQYHRSHELNNACREEMDKAISENFDGMHLKEGFERELMERYGRERVEYILATTVKENAWDGRYSRENRGWAESIPVSESESERIACCLHSHPAVIDGLIRRIRRNEHEKQPKKEEEDLAESKYLKETARGYKVMSIAQDKNGRNVAVVQRKNDFTVAVGYDTSDGTWAQGVYDFKDEKAANEYREKYYGRDVEPPEKWYEVFVSRDALIKTYEKSSLMRMPSSNPEYADYTYFIYNNRIKESRQLVDMQSDSRELCYKLLLTEGEVVHLRNRDGDEVELTAEEFSELVNHTSDKDYKREEKPRVSVNIPQTAMIKEYGKTSLFRAPNGTQYEGYSYYLPNSVLHEPTEGNTGAIARITEDFKVTLRKGTEQTELTAKEFSELIGKTTGEDYKREPTAMDEYREQQAEKEEWKEIAVSEQAVIANYEKSTLFKMPKGKYEGMVYYIPSGMVRRDENGIRLRLPEDFEVHLKDKSANENIDITPAELEAELTDKNDEDYEGIYRRPSEEAKKKFEKVEKNLRESLPDEMKNKPNWVVVRTRENKETGRLDKFLIDVHTDKFAESDNPETWADFDTACKYAKEHGGVALAYALDGTDGIACIDLDHCIGEDGKRSALADEVLAKCGKTYAEQSVSGKGIHVFGKTKGTDLRSFSKDGDMEYYQDRHFITMTGDGAGYSRLESFDTPEMQSLLEHKLERRTEWKNAGKGEAGLSQMDDRELLEKAFSAKNGDTVRRLYHGEDLRHNHSNSDMSLMNYLAFYSGGNVEQMTRIFATSGLYRPDKPASYYEYTAIKAAKDTPHYTPPKASNSAPKAANGGNSK